MSFMRMHYFYSKSKHEQFLNNVYYGCDRLYMSPFWVLKFMAASFISHLIFWESLVRKSRLNKPSE